MQKLKWSKLPKQPTKNGKYILAHRGGIAAIVEFKHGIGFGWQFTPGDLNFGPTHWTKLPEYSEWEKYTSHPNLPAGDVYDQGWGHKWFLSDGEKTALISYLNPDAEWCEGTKTGFQKHSHMTNAGISHDNILNNFKPKYMLKFDLKVPFEESDDKYDRFQYSVKLTQKKTRKANFWDRLVDRRLLKTKLAYLDAQDLKEKRIKESGEWY